MITPSEAIVQLLVQNDLANLPAVAGDWPITSGSMPSGKSTSDKYIQVRRVGATLEGKIQLTGETVEKPRLQLMFRDVLHAGAEEKGLEVQRFLSAVRREEVTYGAETLLVDAVTILTGLTFVKQEEQNQRQLYSLNIQVTLSEVD